MNGLGYLCHISTNTYDNLPQEGEEISLLTYYNISEYKQELYAFQHTGKHITVNTLQELNEAEQNIESLKANHE